MQLAINHTLLATRGNIILPALVWSIIKQGKLVMRFARNVIYPGFLVLLLASGVLAQTKPGAAVDYAALPASAEETTPLVTGDHAPAFMVRTVDNQSFVFDPDHLKRPTILISLS